MLLGSSWLCQQSRQRPGRCGDAGLHRRGDAEGLVNAEKLFGKGEVQAVRSPQMLPLLSEGIRYPREAAHLHADRLVHSPPGFAELNAPAILGIFARSSNLAVIARTSNV